MRKTRTWILATVFLAVSALALVPVSSPLLFRFRNPDAQAAELRTISQRSEFLILEWVQRTLSLIQE